MKKFKNGLVLGKFYPFHLGHKFLIDTAITNCDTVHILVCSLPNETISGGFRANWIKETYKDNKNVKVYHIDKELPQYPNECESVDIFYKLWCTVVYSAVKELDVVFTSEEYGDEFAQYLNVEHFLVDKERKTFPISGTKIRNNNLENWEFIPDVAKSYFTKRVVLLGPESVGKSTMTKMLADHFGVGYVEEYGRTYTEEHGTDNLSAMDFENITMGQSKLLVEELRNNPNKLVICDTEAITTKVFGEMYIDGFENDMIESFIKLQKYDLYLLLDVDVEWKQDGSREFPNEREKHFNKLEQQLNYYNKPYKKISADGDYQKRFEKAVQLVEKLIK